MSRYDSIGYAMRALTEMNRLITGSSNRSPQLTEVIEDLESISKDVRYGGKWEGDFDIIAKSLDYCRESPKECPVCPYRKTARCAMMVKIDAAATIRQMAKLLHEAEEKAQRVQIAPTENGGDVL